MRIRHIALICAMAFVSMVLLSFQISDNNYTEMWKKVKESLSKDLPETAEKQLDAIEKAALSDKNQPQLLKSILYRKQIFSIKEEDTPEKAYIDYAATKFEVLDEVASALLHVDVAMTYSNYLDMNDWTIRNNLPIAGDMSDVEMKYWDKDTFRKLIDQHLDMALQNPEVLKKAETKDWLLIYDDRKDIDKYIEYEMSMFEFVCHSIVNYYKNISSANDVNETWNTQSWWLDEKDFVKVKLDESDSPVIRCLKLFQDLISFSMEKGKESVLVFHDVKRYQFVNDILNKDDPFYEKLETLMHKYDENPLSAEIASVYAKNLVESFSDSDSTTYDNYAKALEIAKTYISKFPKSEGAKQCQSVVDFIVDDDVSIQIQKTQLPNQPIAAVLRYRNTQHPYYRIVKVSEAELLEFNNLSRRELIDKLLKKSAVAEKELDIPAEKDYRRHASVIDLPKLSVGQYYILVKTSKNATDKSNKMATVHFQVSNLNYVYDEEERAITLYVMNRKTGAPMANVDVELFTRKYDYQARKYVNTKIASYKSNSSGKVMLEQQKQNESFHINLRYGNDMLLSERYMHVPEPYNDGQSYSISLFTDRAIYRPGQTVYFKGVVVQRSHDDIQLAEGIKDKLEFFISGNQQEIGEFVTDEYGSYSGSFVIPTDLLNGQFYLRSNYGGTHIRVEEYKRPTFEISFEKPKEQYKLKQDVTIHGSVDAYAGFALDDVKYTYRVIRRTNFPWRLWWWSYPVVEDEQIEYGEAKTDENGKFSITFNLKPSLDVMPDHQPLFVYDVEVTATSAQGETHSKTYSIRAGYNEICISTNISNLIEMNKMSTCQFEVMNMSGEPAKSKVSRKIYRYADNGKVDFFDANGTTYRLSSNMLDRQLLTDEELASKFPEFDFYKENNRQKNRTLVYEDVVDVTEKANLFPANVTFQPGSYYVELKSLDDPLAVNGTEFTLFDSGSKKMPYTSMIWTDVDKKSAQPGETITFSLGSSMNNVKMWVRLMSEKDIRIEKWIDVDNGIVKLPYVVKEEDRGDLMLKVVFVKEGFVKSKNILVSVPFDNLKLNVELATVRDVLTPGAEERWEVTVRDNEKNPVISALLAGMYDASLDVFASNSWYFNLMPWKYGSGNFYYDDGFGINNSSTNVSYIRYFVLFNYSLPSDAPFPVFVGYYGGKSRMIAYSRASNKSVMFDSADEMVVEMAVEESMAVQSAGAAMMVDEEVEEFKESAENGMEENSSSNAEEAMPTIRENFNETAFFYPDLRTNSDGSATFSFVMPDALTRWKLMMLAYTKDNKSGYNTYEFKSSKPVMIMADMPRYMYDNDTLWFVANVINTGDETVVPKAKLEIFDAVTMAPIDIVLSDPVVLMEELVPGRSKEVRWQVAAKHDLGLVAFRFTAYAGEFSDAEQHLLPVLSSEVFMTQTIPITVQADSKKSFDIKKASNAGSNERDYSMTLNFSTNPTWYAVQSLPYLANVSDKRAESAFYVFYANTLSAYIANKIPNLLNYIKKWQIETPDALMSQLEKDQDLKAIMLQETPWVMDAKNETEQRRRIANLFDINAMSNQQEKALTLIKNKQTYNGGWSWWDGMPESPSISTYILSGFGKLKSLGAIESLNQTNQRSVEEICQKAVRCLEYEVAETYREMKRAGKEWPIGSMTLDELYALSFFKEQNSDKDFAAAKKYYLGSLDKNWTDFNFYMRSKAALVLYRNGNEKTARLMLQSFRECAQKDENIGTYWPKKYFSFESHIATHANIMSAFAEIEQDQEMMDQLRVWLLTQKRTNMWENSSSTAEAIYALLVRGSDWLTDDKEVVLTLGNKQISQEGAVAGTGFIQRRWNAGEITDDMKTLSVDNPTKHLVWGGLFRQYFVPIDEVKRDETAFKIKRELFVENVTDKGRELVPISKQTLQVGDKITVKITFESTQDMDHVFVKDLRAAGFEPIEQISRYHYNDNMSYYQTNTDTDMEFFIEFLPKGVHQVEYSMYVTKEGNLTNGYALIQSLYAPEFSAYSDGIRVKVGK